MAQDPPGFLRGSVGFAEYGPTRRDLLRDRRRFLLAGGKAIWRAASRSLSSLSQSRTPAGGPMVCGERRWPATVSKRPSGEGRGGCDQRGPRQLLRLVVMRRHRGLPPAVA